MKLLTHNMLQSNVTGVTRGFPLIIRALFSVYRCMSSRSRKVFRKKRMVLREADEVKVNSVDFNQEFVARMIPKLEWEAFVGAAESLGHGSGLPRELSAGYEKDEDFLKKVHHVLLEVEIVEGALKCPQSGTEFPITRGIPNMLINEEES